MIIKTFGSGVLLEFSGCLFIHNAGSGCDIKWQCTNLTNWVLSLVFFVSYTELDKS